VGSTCWVGWTGAGHAQAGVTHTTPTHITKNQRRSRFIDAHFLLSRKRRPMAAKGSLPEMRKKGKLDLI